MIRGVVGYYGVLGATDSWMTNIIMHKHFSTLLLRNNHTDIMLESKMDSDVCESGIGGIHVAKSKLYMLSVLPPGDHCRTPSTRRRLAARCEHGLFRPALTAIYY